MINIPKEYKEWRAASGLPVSEKHVEDAMETAFFAGAARAINAVLLDLKEDGANKRAMEARQCVAVGNGNGPGA